MGRPFKIPIFQKIVDAWPGKKTFGIYRFLPLFFVIGAGVEFTMINWRVGEVNFYTVYKKKQAELQATKNIENRKTRIRLEEEFKTNA